MPSAGRRGRRRYIALRAEGPAPSASQLEERALAEVRRATEPRLHDAARFRVYPAGPGAAIVRADPATQRAAVRALDGLAVGAARLRTLTTSGTLRQARRALGVRAGARRGARRARAAGTGEGAAGPRRPPPNP